MSEYEAEVTRTLLGWTYRLLLNGEKVSAFPLGPGLYSTRDRAIEAATREAAEHRETQKTSRVPIQLDEF